MKYFLLMLMFMSFSAFGKFLSYQDFTQLTPTQQEEVLTAYKDFLSKQDLPLSDETASNALRFSLISEAYAASSYNCFFAGWPSRSRVGTSGKSVCTSPLYSNPEYKKLSASCGGASMLCQPMLFGKVGCVPTATQAQRNSAFATCEQKFKSSGMSIQSLAKEIVSNGDQGQAEDIFGLVNSVCLKGSQANTSMCRNLEDRVADIVKDMSGVAVVSQPEKKPEVQPKPVVKPELVAKPEKIVPRPEPKPVRVEESDDEEIVVTASRKAVDAARIAAKVLSKPVQVPDPDCIEEKDGSEAVKKANLAVLKKFEPIPGVRRISCPKPNRSMASDMNIEDLEKALKYYNVKIVNPPIRDLRGVRNFLDEMAKFPRSLIEEMKDQGAEISIMEGDGVAMDPSFANTNPESHQTYQYRLKQGGQRWDKIPGSGGSVQGSKSPTRIVVNHLYNIQGSETTHGASNLCLHEHGHTLDTLYRQNSLSNSRGWRAVLAQDQEKTKNFLNTICGSYCIDNSEEGFAELFSYYHACDQSRAQMESEVPAIADFFKNLTTVRDYLQRDGQR